MNKAVQATHRVHRKVAGPRLCPGGAAVAATAAQPAHQRHGRAGLQRQGRQAGVVGDLPAPKDQALRVGRARSGRHKSPQQSRAEATLARSAKPVAHVCAAASGPRACEGGPEGRGRGQPASWADVQMGGWHDRSSSVGGHGGQSRKPDLGRSGAPGPRSALPEYHHPDPSCHPTTHNKQPSGPNSRRAPGRAAPPTHHVLQAGGEAGRPLRQPRLEVQRRRRVAVPGHRHRAHGAPAAHEELHGCRCRRCGSAGLLAHASWRNKGSPPCQRCFKGLM